MIQQVVFAAVKNSEALSELIADRVYGRGALGRTAPADPLNPYLMLGWDESTPYYGVQESSPGVAASTLRVYGYDDPSTYDRIKQCLSAVRDTMNSLIGSTDDDSGVVVTGVRWMGDSADQYDQVKNRNIKFSTYQVTART